jgi:hypothetical protein
MESRILVSRGASVAPRRAPARRPGKQLGGEPFKEPGHRQNKAVDLDGAEAVFRVGLVEDEVGEVNSPVHSRVLSPVATHADGR